MNYLFILSIGLIFLSGLALSGVLRKVKIPSVTAYIVLGIILGPIAFNVISPVLLENSDIISTVVLSIIAFSLGQNFSKENFSIMGKDLLAISLGESIAAALFVCAGIYILTGDIVFSLALASVSATTAPATIVMVARELNIKGKFSKILLGTVALDDMWGIVIFALVLAIIRAVGAGTVSAGNITVAVTGGVLEIIGAIILGVAMGVLLSYFSKMITSKSELLILTLGFILFNTGISLFLGFSALLSSMAMSSALSNVNTASFKFFNSVRAVDSPLYLLFFVLAGAKLQITALSALGIVGLTYIIFRMAGKIAGVHIASMAADVPAKIRNNLGLALAPQAGVALGLAMILASAYPDPETGTAILSVIVATTVVFEIFGPFLTRYALIRSSRH